MCPELRLNSCAFGGLLEVILLKKKPLKLTFRALPEGKTHLLVGDGSDLPPCSGCSRASSVHEHGKADLGLEFRGNFRCFNFSGALNF